ncbi:VWA domain-containing protein [Pseudonocardia bannensis]|uniref:VWA domain-containing protein n=1 Tax=Pseudonocardia bannensis TaxID=630973 RepID=A0A848DN17_9PSEU|nr:VWA domain-containing protein [Pseudonocardia bannensis]NMH94088.1 VWA domain-containing protein [Pseudonocardia bannensis]
MRGRIAAISLLLGLLGWLGQASATAQEADRGDVALTDVTVQDGRVRFLVTGLDRGSGAAALTGTVKLRVDGYSVAAQAAVPEVQPELAPRTTMLVIDTSGSMAGPLLDEAKAAAGSFLDAAPEGDRIGLVAFADRPVLLAPPTAPRAVVRDAVRGLSAAGQTSLYDAVDLALTALGTEGDRQVLVMSDGPDTVSALNLPGLLNRTQAGDARVDVVSVRPAADGATDPQQAAIAQAGGGQVFRAQSAGEASQVFRDQAAQDSTTVAVDAALPPGLTASTARLQLTLPWGGRTVEIDTTTPLAAGTAPVGEIAPEAGESWPWLAAGLAGVFGAVALIVVALVAVPRSVRDRRRVQKLVARYGAEGRGPASPSNGLRDGALREGALELAERVVARRGIGERLAARLDRAAVAWRPNEWLLLCVAVGLAATAVLGLLLGSPSAGIVLGAPVGWLGPRLFLSVRASRRLAAFGTDLPDALQLVASGLSSGYSLPQALDSVVRLGDGPIAVEVGRALAQSRLGTPVEDALEQVADRMDSVDFRWVVMAIRVQREVGGNLADVLLQVAETIRERAWLRRHVKALSAEGRLSGVILAALPPVIGGYMYLVRPEYAGALVTEPLGLVMLAAGAVMLVIGMIAMNKIAKVEL